MGQRSRKRRREGERQDHMAELYARGRARDAQARAKLQPLDRDERPRAVTIAAIVAAVLAIANVAAAPLAEDRDLGDWQGSLLASAVLAIAAVGMWLNRYWAVLGFQIVLLLSILGASTGLIVAKNALAVVLCVAVIAGGGALFYVLIRAMARMQLPKRPASE